MAASAMQMVAFYCAAVGLVVCSIQSLALAQGAEDPMSGQDGVSKQLDVVFLFHTSSQMNPTTFGFYKTFMKDILQDANIDNGDVKVAAVTYVRRGRQLFNFNKYSTKNDAFVAIDAIKPKLARRASLTSGIETVTSRLLTSRGGDRPSVKNMVVILTDANSNQGQRELKKAAEQLRLTGSLVFAIGVGLRDVGELQTVASSVDHMYSVPVFEQLGGLKSEIVFRVPELRKMSDALIDNRDDRKADFVIAYHLQSKTKNFWISKYLKNFMNSLVSKADLDNGNVRVGLVNFARRTREVVHLNAVSSKRQFGGEVKKIHRNSRARDSNGGNMVKWVTENMFTVANGDRPDVPNHLLILMDGPITEDMPGFIAEATKAKGSVKIVTVGVWKANMGQLEKVASEPIADNVIKSNSYKELPGHKIVNRIRKTLGFLAAPGRGTGKKATTTTTLPPPLSDCVLGRADLVMVVDSSTSVTQRNFRKILNFVEEFLSKADIDTGNVRVGFMIYSSKVDVQFHLNDYSSKEDMLAVVRKTAFSPGQTNTAGALDVVRTKMFAPDKGDRPDIANVVVMLTDGVSTVNPQNTVPNARRAHDDGILIYTIGVGLSDTRELDQIATPPARFNSFKVANFDELREVDDRIFASACPKIFSMPSPTTTTTSTTTTTPTTTTSTTTTTTTTTTPRRKPVYSPTGTDIIVMLDSTVDDQVFSWMKRFVADFASQVDIDSGKWRVGAMTFDGSSPRTNFYLSDNDFKDEVLAKIDLMKNRPSRSKPRVGVAFDHVRRNMFTDRNGDRPLARNYIILLTGNKQSLNSRKSYAAATRLKDVGTGIYTIGLNFRDSTELDEISSKPIPEHEMIVNSWDELSEVPGMFIYSMNNEPAPTTRQTTRATTTTTTPRPTVRYEGTCKSKGDVVFLLDTSGSVGLTGFHLMRDFIKAIVRDLEIDNGFFRVGLMTFSDSSRVEFMLNAYNNREDVYNALDRMEYVYGSTNTADALRRIRTEMFITMNGDRLDVPNMVIVVSDGQSNINHIETLPEARRLKSTGTTILTVGVGVSQNAELKGMTSPPDNENYIEVSDFEQLHSITQSIVAPLCTDSNMCDRDPCQNEGVCVDGLRSYMCVCQPGYYGNNCEKVCGPPADVVLILDSSTSVGPMNFDEIKSYAQRMVSEMEVLYCGIHVGVIKYSSAAMIQFNLGVLDTEEEINRAIERISYTRGRSNMAEAIRVVRTMMFNGVNGDRYDARNIAYLITDGTTEINREGTQTEAELMIDSGTRLIPIAVGLRDRRELDFIADQQGMSVMEIESETKLMEMKDQVLEAVYDLNNRCSPNPCDNQGKCINEPMGFRCECPAGFTGDVCEKECSGKSDIVFVVDSSRYNSGREFRAIKRFLREVVKRMAFRGENFRVAVVSYGSATRIRLGLMDGDRKRPVKAAISALRRVKGDPQPEQAVGAVSYNVIGKSGDRENAANYVVFVTRRIGSHATVHAMNKIKAQGARVIGVGVKLSTYESNLLKAAVSSPLDKSLYLANRIEDLEAMSRDFVQFVCEDTNKCAENPCQNNGVCVNGQKTYACKCPTGYAGKNCERTCDDRADVVFLLDSSGSVGFDNFRRLKEFVSSIVDGMNIGADGTRVGVITYSDKSTTNIYLNDHDEKRKLQAAIAGMSYEYGNTNTGAALGMARSGLFVRNRGDRPDVPNFIILITDGLSNVHSERTIPEAEAARRDGIHIFVLGVGISEAYEMEQIASKPINHNIVTIDSYNNIFNTGSQLLDKTCRDNSVCQENPCQNGGVCSPKIGGFTCECQNGFQGEKCEINCSQEKDIAIIMDSSASVGNANFKTMLMFVKSLIKSMTEGGQNHHFAFITYNTGVKTIFSFDRYGTPEEIMQAVETTAYQPGSTNTADGLKVAKDMFGRGFGARRSADSIAILLTDGQSNVNYWNTVPAANELKASNVRVMGIGIALTRHEEINSIASSTSDVYQVTSFEGLKDILPDIVRESCVSRK